jgi:hypothetical protein
LEISKKEKHADSCNTPIFKHKIKKRTAPDSEQIDSKKKVSADATAHMPFPISCHQNEGLNSTYFYKLREIIRLGRKGSDEGRGRGYSGFEDTMRL